jgi:hypothetical protein
VRGRHAHNSKTQNAHLIVKNRLVLVIVNMTNNYAYNAAKNLQTKKLFAISADRAQIPLRNAGIVAHAQKYRLMQ